VAFSEQRILPAKRVRKPSDCLVPCLASKLVINSALLMARKAMTVPADRTPLGREQSFHPLIGAALAADARGGLNVWERLKHPIKKGNLRRCTRCADKRDRTKAGDLVRGCCVLKRIMVGRDFDHERRPL
jgi:hypothetical protein